MDIITISVVILTDVFMILIIAYEFRKYIRKSLAPEYPVLVLQQRVEKQDQRLADLIVKYEILENRLSLQPIEHRTYFPMRINYEEPQKIIESGGRSIESATSTKKILNALVEKDMTAIQVMQLLGCSREHAARLMKQLNDRRLVQRVSSRKPYLYRITSEGRNFIQST